jgi:hypothetical protein
MIVLLVALSVGKMAA